MPEDHQIEPVAIKRRPGRPTDEVKAQRFELRMAPSLMAKIDDARGEVPRAHWMTRAFEAALATDAGSGAPAHREKGPDSGVPKGHLDPAPPQASIAFDPLGRRPLTSEEEAARQKKILKSQGHLIQ